VVRTLHASAREDTVAVASREDALSALQKLINHQPVQIKTILRAPYLPSDLEPPDDPAGINPSTSIGGYGDEARYILGGDDPKISRAIAQSPADTLSGHPTITRDETAAAYLKASLDLTMEGGTTSGVVYPLAVCELATSFRFRNVGGASAGAIAAALTAAAELGRSGPLVATNSSEQQTSNLDSPSKKINSVPVRRGFTGLTDIIGWLTQTPSGGSEIDQTGPGGSETDQPRRGRSETDQYRLAQLFRPGQRTARIFRVAVAAMRGRTWPLPLLALFAFGRFTRLATLALILGAIVLTGYVEWRFTGAPRSVPELIGLGVIGVLFYIITLVGIALIGQGIRSALRGRRTDTKAPGRLEELLQYTSRYATPPRMTLQQLSSGAVLIIVVVAFAFWRPPLYASAVLVGLAASLVIAIGLSMSILAYIRKLRSRAFGIVAGTTPRRSRNPLDVMAGVPKPTVDKSLVPWLNDCLNALAGLPDDQVLRFGHLWSGLDYHNQLLVKDASEWRQMSKDPNHRLINLELMTTDLTRQRPFRFPLDANKENDPEQLWVCIDQLRDGESQLFPEPILQALSKTDCVKVIDRDNHELTLHKLPQPWDLPVIFAVRISMSLPALFQAVRLYRIRKPGPVQDDFGRTLIDQGEPLRLPLVSAQELWFSDGGITSNFPVHFFDNSLPRWPTVSLNLGTHPEGAPHQDIWLPQDWDDLNIPVKTLGSSGWAFGQAIFNTAMSWRDSLQSALPGYRNRIAQVRTSPGEGGANLFMPREIIASMALRGALAGARLRTRFANDAEWDRFRWLRLRTALSNMEKLRASTDERRGFYADALETERWLNELKDKFSDNPADKKIRWYRPYEGFWPKAAQLLDTFARSYRPDEDPKNVMTCGTPRPEPVIRQVPRE
jgi:predicted acylesterase/phospholipase RssA